MEEDKNLVMQILNFCDTQSKKLHQGAIATCEMYRSMTTMFEKHKNDTETLDGTISDELTDELDQYDEKHSKREKKKMAKLLHKLRYSPEFRKTR